MKRFLYTTVALLTLSSCGFQSRADFMASLDKKNVEYDENLMPKITYVSDDGREKELAEENLDKSEDKINFIDLYGKGKTGKFLDPAESLGNIKETKLLDSSIGISLLKSIGQPGGYSTFLSYEKDGEFLEREFGPIGGFQNLSSMVAYDMIQSESGPMLLVSMVSTTEYDTYSAYYIFNKFMGLMDYMVFRNSIDDIDPSVERLGEMVKVPELVKTGDIDQAIEARIDTEKEHLPSLLDVYKIDVKPVTGMANGRQRTLGYLPDIKSEDRILEAKTTDDPANQGASVDIN